MRKQGGKRRRTQQGFTLIEALVATAILGIVIGAITSMLPGLAVTNARTSDEQRAVLAAKAYFESVRSAMQINFDSDPTVLPVPGTGGGLSCTRLPVKNLDSVNGAVALKQVGLSCTIRGHERLFSLDVARPL